jgi:addiction module HigA family antidote
VTLEYRQETAWRNSRGIVRANTVYGSTTNGEYALSGRTVTSTRSKSPTIIVEGILIMENKIMLPIHPGEILIKEFLEPMGITQYRLAKDISVSPRRINEIVHGKRSVTADTALRLSRYFGTSEKFWMNLQTRYDMELYKDILGDRLQKEVVILSEK